MNLSDVWYNALENLTQKQIRTYHVRIGHEQLNFYPKDIIRIEADGSYSQIITDSKKYTLSRNLKYIEGIIHGWGFIRINRSCIVNVIHIQKVDKRALKIIMSDNVSIKIPRRLKHRIVQKLQFISKSAHLHLF